MAQVGSHCGIAVSVQDETTRDDRGMGVAFLFSLSVSVAAVELGLLLRWRWRGYHSVIIIVYTQAVIKFIAGLNLSTTVVINMSSDRVNPPNTGFTSADKRVPAKKL